MVNNKFLGSLIPKFKIDGSIVDKAVDNDLSWKIRYERDENQKGLIHKVTNQLVFIGPGYDTLNDLRKADNCATTEIGITAVDRYCNQTDVFTGVTYLKDIKFDLGRCTATGELRDRTFYGILNDNKDVKVSLNAATSKNGEDISSYQNPVPIDFPIPPSSTPTALNRTCISVFDAFKIMLAYISDNRLTFQSDYFETGDGADYMILRGSELRTGAGYYPQISFRTLFNALSKLRNLAFSVSDVNGSLILRIEEASYFEKTTTLLEFDRVPNIQMELIDQELYNIVNVGSTTHETTGTLQDLRWLNSKEESYTIATDCGYDKTLNLVVEDLVISSNTFEEVLGGNTDYDDDTFLVETDGTAALTDDIYHLGSYILNRGFLNDQIISNYFGFVPGNIAQELGTGSIKFRAQKNTFASYTTTSIGTETPSPVISFPNDSTGGNFDPASLWDTGSYRYTAPAAGVFALAIDLHTRTSSFPIDTGGLKVKVVLNHYDSANTLIDTSIREFTWFRTGVPNAVSSVDDHLILSGSLFMQLADYVNVIIKYSQLTNTFGTTGHTVGFYLGADSYIACTGGSDGGGVFETGDPTKLKKYRYRFKYPITFTEHKKLAKDPLGIIKFSPTADMNDGIDCWLDAVTIDPRGGICEWELRSNQILE